ncbi:MAG TPA: DUF3341 domain-containing protein [Vicinamibacterales bacterium]|nr:DUF3341 domain-containing protein [Vicinamibacterales bacterium]
MEHQRPVSALYGLMAEFEDPTALVGAARRSYDEGYRRFDSFSPFPIHELFGAMRIEDRRVPLMVLGAGILGGLTGFGLQYWVSAVSYPLNIGGRPYVSWPMFIPVTFELTILFAAIAAVFGMFGLNGLPRPYHPVFNVPSFAEHASQDGFFLAIEADDPMFDLERTRAFLVSLGAKEVNDIEP